MPAESPLDPIRTTLNADREALRAAVERVPRELRGHRPAPDRWSVAEILEHLGIVEGRSTALLAPQLADAPLLGGPAAVTGISQLRQFTVDRSRAVVAPETIRPTGKVDADSAWAALETSRNQLLELMRGAEGRDLTVVTRTHPVLGRIDGYQWLSSIGAHEARHTAQIAEIADQFAAESSREPSAPSLLRSLM
jgi:hypothetical protein